MNGYSIPPPPPRPVASEPKSGVPGGAKVACWVTVAAIVVFNVSWLVLLVLPEDPDTGTEGAGGLIALMVVAFFAYVVALVLGVISLIQSIKRRSNDGILLALVPVLGLAVAWVIFGVIGAAAL